MGRERMLCVLPWPEPVEILNGIRKQFPDLEVEYIHRQTSLSGHNQEPLPEVIWKNINILVTLGAFPPSPESCPKLQLVHVLSAGADYVVKSPIFEGTDIVFTTSSGIHGPQIAEWVILTMLVQNHHYNVLYEQQKDKVWRSPYAASGVRDYVGQRLGVLGYGSIGRQAAHVAKALGMDVIAFTASPRDTPEKRKDHGFIVTGTGDPDGSIPSKWYSGLEKSSLREFLKQDIDVLLVSVPLTKESRHMISTAEFEILSNKKALISNIARGPIIDQSALVKALHDGKVRGATLDVTDPEPLPKDDPLWSAPNVTITPHISGNTINYANRGFQVLTVNLEKRAKGKPLINVIDRKKGY